MYRLTTLVQRQIDYACAVLTYCYSSTSTCVDFFDFVPYINCSFYGVGILVHIFHNSTHIQYYCANSHVHR